MYHAHRIHFQREAIKWPATVLVGETHASLIKMYLSVNATFATHSST